jgi:hypothetical protein
MGKRSREVAAKYSQLSKQGKKRQRSRNSHGDEPAQVSVRTGVAQPKTKPEPKPAPVAAGRPAAVPQARHAITVPGFDYMKGDLRRIGVLAGAAVVVLIILSFVLG